MECQKAALEAVQHEAESAKADLRQEFEMREEHLKQVLQYSNNGVHLRARDNVAMYKEVTSDLL